MKKFRVFLIYAAIFIVILLLLDGFSLFGSEVTEIEYSVFLNKVEADELGKVELKDGMVQCWTRVGDGEKYASSPDYTAYVPSYEVFAGDMAAIFSVRLNKPVDTITSTDYNFEFVYLPPSGTSIWLVILPYAIMIGGVLLLFFFIMRSQNSGNNNVMSFTKSRARMQGEENKVTFADVAGADEEKEELREVVDFMREPQKFTKMGARIPKGILLVGPPGTGKTLLAKAAAGESKVPFYSISGSDFVEMFVGVGASRVRDLFMTAKKAAPAVIFIDEIDAVGRHRGAGLGGGHDEREQTLNQLLVEMDGFLPNEGIIIIAATNRPDILDPALLRPGRFDRQITVNIPDVKGREEILKVHAKNKTMEEGIRLDDIAKSTPGFTGADLENLLNEAAILATRANKTAIGMVELNEAITRVIMGPEKKSRVITPEDKKITAFHESGHAAAALMLENCDPLREISVIPRGLAAGYTITMPGNEFSHMKRGKILDTIAMTLGGRAAEAVALDDICTGAYGDLKSATGYARKMVVEYGMSDKIGPVFLGGDEEVFVGRDFMQHRNMSDAYAAHVDDEVKSILETQYERVVKMLTDRKDDLTRVANVLIEREHLTGEEFAKVFNGGEELSDASEE